MPNPQPRKRKAPASRSSRPSSDTVRRALKRQIRAEREIPKLTRELRRAIDRSNAALGDVVDTLSYERAGRMRGASQDGRQRAEVDAAARADEVFGEGEGRSHAKA